MCLVGACYTDGASVDQIRDLTNLLEPSLRQDCRDLEVDLGVSNDHSSSIPNTIRLTDEALEKLQALVLLSILLAWNGNPTQRNKARDLFPKIATIARSHGLLRVSSSLDLKSSLHQSDLSLEHATIDNFDWITWVRQEARIRLMYMLYLTDVAYGLYFNEEPQFDSLEVHIPLPADDAAWEANTSDECAEALHLYGSEAAKERNPDGSQRTKQPELDLAIRALFHESYQIHPGSTNLNGKFILIHALLAQARRAQFGADCLETGASNLSLSSIDWVFSPPASDGLVGGVSTPLHLQNSNTSSRNPSIIYVALNKFKQNWDMDMAIQFPPSTSNSRRYGFSRDGIHFFYLAQWLMKNGHPDDLKLPPDHRLSQIIQLLKFVKSWVVADGAQRGEELGSVGEIDQAYGLHDMTLKLTDLFKPLPEQVVTSPHMPAVKTEI